MFLNNGNWISNFIIDDYINIMMKKYKNMYIFIYYKFFGTKFNY